MGQKIFSLPIALFTLICVGTIRAEIKTVYSMEKTYNKSVQVQIYSRETYFSHLVCDMSAPMLSPTNCTIFHQVMDGKSQQLSCPIQLQGHAGVLFHIVHPFTSDKTIIMWGNNSVGSASVKYTIVNFHDCKTVQVDVKVDALPDFKRGNLLTFGLVVDEDETFSVLFNNAKLCKNKACRITFDTQGRKVNGPVPWFTPLHGGWVSVFPAGIAKSYEVVEYSWTSDKYRVSLVNDAGQQVLKEENSSKRGKDYDISTTHQIRRICGVDESNSTIHCEVVDANGVAVSNVTINLGYQVDGIMVRNLAGGEFLLVDQTDYRKFIHVVKVGADGKIIGTVKLPELDCKNDKSTFSYVFFDKADNPYYLSSICHKTACQCSGILKAARYNFNDEDFK